MRNVFGHDLGNVEELSSLGLRERLTGDASDQVQVIPSSIYDGINNDHLALLVDFVKHEMLLGNQHAIPSRSKSAIAGERAAFREVRQTVDLLL